MKRLLGISDFTAKLRARLGRDHDMHALQCLSGFNIDYIPWTSSAMRPSGLRVVVNEVIIHQRKKGLEFGAGISTLFLAKAFERVGGSLTIIEHDVVWLEKTRIELERIHVKGSTCNLIHAPLVCCDRAATAKSMWYNEQVLAKNLGDSPFDFCLVDGPIASEESKAVRKPVCEFMKGRLNDSYAIFVDDIDRPKDLELAREWAEILKGRMTVYAAGAIAVIRPSTRTAYNIF